MWESNEIKYMKNYEKIHEKYLLVPERQTFKIFYIFATKWLKAISPFVLMPLCWMGVGKFWRKAALSPSKHWAV